MNTDFILKTKLERAVIRINDEIVKSRSFSVDWKRNSENRLYSELVSCILGSRVRYEQSKKCFNSLLKNRLINYSSIITNPEKYLTLIQCDLRRNGYPFAKSKANGIVLTALQI